MGGRKLRLNEKIFKVKKSPFGPVENLIKLEKIVKEEDSEDTADPVDIGDSKSVEIGTCKYCDQCIALQDMKDHYLTHLDKDHTDTKPIKIKEDEEETTTVKTKVVIISPALQENYISSTEIIHDTKIEETEQDICKTVEMSKKDIEEKVKQNFDAYAKDPTTRDDCSKFIKRWGPILDIDDVSQYDEFDATKLNM